MAKFSIKKRTVVIIIAVVLLLGGCVIFVSIRFGGQVQYNPLTRRVFRIDSEDVKSVRLQSGNTGAVIEYTDREDIEEMIGHLNSFRYKRRVPDPVLRAGWSALLLGWEITFLSLCQ
jgi:hypothetical protein